MQNLKLGFSQSSLIFVCGLFLLIVSPMWLSDGMFMDGIYYATIARNWAEGLGSFWRPHFTDTLGNPFYDHPPLAFFLEGLFFKALGDHYWVERIYSMSCHLAMAWLLWKIWCQLVLEKFKSLFWMPLLLWLTVSKVSWSACNNLLENTLMLFTSASIYFAFLYLHRHKKAHAFLAGILLFLGFLAKGFVALFPLSLFFFAFLFRKNFRFNNLLQSYALQFIGLFFPLLVLHFFWPEAIDSIWNYIQIQVLASLDHAVNVESRFFILGRFVEETLIMSILCFLLFIWNRLHFKIKPFFVPEHRESVFILMALGLSGILPILISLKQSTFYINPVFPLFALLVGLLCAPFVFALTQKISEQSKGLKLYRWISVLVLLSGIISCLFFSNQVNRDHKRLQDIRAIIEDVPQRETLFVSFEIYREWSLYAYFYRYGHVSLDAENPEAYEYMIKQKDQFANIPKGFVRVRSDLNELDLYRRE